MTWFWIALIPPIIWAVANHMDKYLVERFYNRNQALPGTLMFFNSIMGALIGCGLLVALPQIRHIPIWALITLLVAGATAYAAVFPYIFALMRDEASRVVPLFQLGPVYSFVLGWVFLHEHLTPVQILAGVIIVIGAVTINMDIDDGFRLKKGVLGLMLLSAGLFALEAFLFKFAALEVGFWAGAAYQYLGAALAGVALAVFRPDYRRSFVTLFRANRRYVTIYGLIDQTIGVAARISFNYATLLAPLVLISLVGNFQPFFAIAIGTLLTIFLPHISTEAISRRHLGHKLISTAVIFAGTYLLLHK